MKIERFSPDPKTEPRHWVRDDQAFVMMLGGLEILEENSPAAWRKQYNEERPHSSLGYRTPKGGVVTTVVVRFS